jgi:hypothetical protein
MGWSEAQAQETQEDLLRPVGPQLGQKGALSKLYQCNRSRWQPDAKAAKAAKEIETTAADFPPRMW